MKKLINIIAMFCLVLTISLFSFGCNNTKAEILIVSPDGAPALSLASMMETDESFGEDIKYTIVDSQNITGYVQTKKADIAIVPLNIATKFTADYKIAAVNTHGNFYIIGTDTIENISDLIGKKIAVIQYQNVPGLTFRALLKGNNVGYNQLGEVSDTVDSTKVNIYGGNLDANSIAGLFTAGSVDYALVAEPAASTLSNKLSAKGIKICYDIQSGYEETFGEGFPQAVTIIKNELINSNKELVNKFIQSLKNNDEYLTGENISKIVNSISSHMEEGVAPTLSEANLTLSSMKGCNVRYVDALSIKTQINSYISRVKDIDSTKIDTLTEDSYYSVK